MKAFHFTLEAVATVRRRQEQKAMEKYAQALAAQHQAAEALTRIESDLEASLTALRQQLITGCTAATVTQAHAYQRGLALRRDEGLRVLETAGRRVQAELQAMLATRQQREIVDKFYEKQKAGFERAQGRTEQKLMDELAAGRRNNSLMAWRPMEHSL